MEHILSTPLGLLDPLEKTGTSQFAWQPHGEGEYLGTLTPQGVVRDHQQGHHLRSDEKCKLLAPPQAY